MNTNLLEQVLKLPPPDRLKLADEIYRSVHNETSDEPFSKELLTELELRDTRYEANPASGCTLKQLESKLFKRR
jgi:putative addiction module component (TIGR02574 family)